MASRARVLAVGHTDVGMKRAHNEDNFDVIDEYNLYVVADGMGGHASGEVASQMAIDTLREFFRATHADPEATWPYKMDKSRGYEENRLMTSIKLANLRIYESAQRDPKLRGMGTTIVGCMFVGDYVYVAHVGDSRCYRLRDGVFKQLTSDHTLGNLIGARDAEGLRLACGTALAMGGGVMAIAAVAFVVFRETLPRLYVEDLAVDSVRLRAHASTHEVRTESRSTKRLKELNAHPPDASDPEAVRAHAEKVRKHQDALARLNTESRTNLVLTNPSAGLMKFPTGASGPGHRVTVVASGVTDRIALGLLIDGSGADSGKLGPALANVIALLDAMSIGQGKRFVVAADAGYFTERDLKWADEHRDRVDVLVHEATMSNGGRTTMDRGHFTIPSDGTAPTCPAGTTMAGPYDRPSGEREWKGIGCGDCPLRTACTTGTQRTIVLRPEFERLRDQMRERMKSPEAKERYSRRIATIEPVFSQIQETMGFRRVSTRLERGVRGEIFLKFLAHNIGRLIAGRRLRRLYFLAPTEFWSTL